MSIASNDVVSAVWTSVDDFTDHLFYWPKQAVNLATLTILGLVVAVLFSLLFMAYALVCASVTTLSYMKEKMGVSPSYDPFKDLTESIRSLVALPTSEPEASEQGAEVAVPSINLDPVPSTWSRSAAFSVQVQEPAFVPETPVLQPLAQAEAVALVVPGKYTSEDLAAAVADVLAGRESVRGAAKKYKVPQSTLSGAVKRSKGSKG